MTRAALLLLLQSSESLEQFRVEKRFKPTLPNFFMKEFVLLAVILLFAGCVSTGQTTTIPQTTLPPTYPPTTTYTTTTYEITTSPSITQAQTTTTTSTSTTFAPVQNSPGCRLAFYNSNNYQTLPPGVTFGISVVNYNGTQNQVLWSSSDARVASVGPIFGTAVYIQAERVGSALIIATDTGFKGDCRAYFNITVS